MEKKIEEIASNLEAPITITKTNATSTLFISRNLNCWTTRFELLRNNLASLLPCLVVYDEKQHGNESFFVVF